MRTTLLSIVAAAAVAGAALAQTTIQIPASKDNTLYEDPAGFLSNGAGQHLFAGLTGFPEIRRALIQFDVAAAVPAGALILDARMQLNVSRSLIFGPLAVTAHRVSTDWGERNSVAPGQEGTGGPAAPGDATWLHTFHATSFWTTVGGDFAAAASATSMTPQNGPAIWTGAGLVADVQSFLNQPANNHGWLLKTDEQFGADIRRFDSRENLIPANRPVLTVTYLAAGSVQVLGMGCSGSNGRTFTLSHSGTPTPGGGFALVHAGGQPGALAGNLVSLGVLPAGAPVYPGCNTWLNPLLPAVTYNVLFLDGSGGSTTPYPVVPGFLGLPLGFMGFALDAGLPAGFVLSNGLRVVIG